MMTAWMVEVWGYMEEFELVEQAEVPQICRASELACTFAKVAILCEFGVDWSYKCGRFRGSSSAGID